MKEENLWQLAGADLLDLYSNTPQFYSYKTPFSVAAITQILNPDMNLALIDHHAQAQAWLLDFSSTLRRRNLPVLLLVSERMKSALFLKPENFGFVESGFMPLMIRQNAPLNFYLPNYRVEKVQDEQYFSQIQDLMATCFEIPPEQLSQAFRSPLLKNPACTIWVTFEQDQIVSSLITFRRKNYIGIWGMCTTPQARRKQIASTMMQRMITDSISHGATHFYLFASPAGQPLYQSLGFELRDRSSVWIMPATQQP